MNTERIAAWLRGHEIELDTSRPRGSGAFYRVFEGRFGIQRCAVSISKERWEDVTHQEPERMRKDYNTLCTLGAGGVLRAIHLVAMFSVFQDVDGHLVHIWELADPAESADRTKTLRTIMDARSTGMDRAEAVRFFQMVAAGINSLKVAGFRHGDLKPENVLAFGEALKLGDLSQIKHIGDEPPSSTGVHNLKYCPHGDDWRRNDPYAWDTYAMVLMYVEARTGRYPFGDTCE
mgnify:CR=1 FL=1